MNTRPKATKLIEMAKSGAIDAIEVLENVLLNYMTTPDAEDFADSEYFMDDLPDVENDIEEDDIEDEFDDINEEYDY